MESFSSAKSCSCSAESWDSICAESASLKIAASGVGIAGDADVEEPPGPDQVWSVDVFPLPWPEPDPGGPAALYRMLFSFSRTRSILFSTIDRCALAAPSSPRRKNQRTASRTVRIVRAVSSALICSADFPDVLSSPSDNAPDPPAHLNKRAPATLWPYRLRSSVASVSWRRVSADARLEMEAARSRSRRAVDESTESRSVSVRCVWVEEGVLLFCCGVPSWRLEFPVRRCEVVVVER